MKKVNAVSNTGASAGKIDKASVQNSRASVEPQKSNAVKSEQQITSVQPLENQDRCSELFNLVGSGVAVYKAVDKGKDFIITDFNRAAEKIERTSRKKVIGRRVTEVFPGIREMSLLKTFQRVWRTGRPEYHPAAIYKGESLKSWRENYVYKLPSGEIMAIYEDITERKQAEARIADEATRRRILIDQSRDGIVILDTDGRVYETNKRFAEMLGYTQKEVLGLHVWDWDFKLPKKQIVQMIRDVDETGDHFETQHKRKDGSIFDVAISTNGSLFAGQKLIFCVSRDITEKKRIEMKLRESEERFRGLFENSPVSLWEEDFSAVKRRLDIIKAEGVTNLHDFLVAHPKEVFKCASLIKILDVNKSALNMYGAKDKQHLIDKMAKIVSIESSGKFVEELVNISNGLTRFNYETINQAIGGRKINISISWAAAPGHENDLSRVLISIVDITERKQAELALKNSEQRFKDIAENAKEWIWEVDVAGRYTYTSQIVENTLGYTPEEILQRHFYDNFLPGDRESLKAAAFVVFSTKKPFREFLNRNLHKNGQTVFLSTSAVPVLDNHGNLLGYRGSDTDITERKEAEAKMDHLITELRDLSETEKKNRIFAEALAKNVSVINSSLKAEEVMDSIIDSISNIVPYDAASVMMVNGQQARIVRSKGYREKGLEKWVEQAQFDLNKIKDFNSIIRNKKYKVTPNTETSKDWTVVAETAWVKSHITSPIIENSQVIGFLNLDSATPDFYSEDHAKVLMSFSEQVSTALKNARQFEETQRRMDRMQAMTQIDLAINSSLDINVSLEIVLIQAKDKLNADAVDILQVNNGTNSLVFSKAKGFKTDEIRKANFRLGTGLPGRAVLERALIAIPDLRTAPESYFRNLLVEREGFASYYCAPLITKGELKGVMEIYFHEPYQADQEWREFLEMLAQQTAIAINNAELLNSLKVSNADLMNAYETTLKGWVDALDMRDHETEGHTRRVTELSLQLALRMGIKDSEIVNFERGALLHDIGKVGVSDTILNKSGPLTEEEWAIMRQHPLYAFQLLSKSKYLIPALDIPYCHHEKWDGSGYPRGLKGEAIPVAARIFAVVDVWDALISDRPYRSAWTQKQALDHIQEQSGQHFDPKVVSAFMSLPKTEFKK